MPQEGSDGRCTSSKDTVDRIAAAVNGFYYETEDERRFWALMEAGQEDEARDLWDKLAQLPDPDPDEDERLIDADCINNYAGYAATARYTGRPFLECLEGSSDEEQADAWLLKTCDPIEVLPSVREDMQRRALDLVADPANWRAIEALADALERDEKIDGETANEILAKALA